MARIKDRTEDFKDAMHRAAISREYNESNVAAVLASFVMHKPRQRSPFTKAALKMLESIGALEQFLMKHKRDYVDLHRTTEQERDGIEHEVLILSERLLSVTSQFDQLRAIRFQEAINRTIPRRKLKRVAASNSTDNAYSNNMGLKEPKRSDLREPEEAQTRPTRGQQQLLDDETRALRMELGSLLDAAQETETKMAEISALNHLMSTHVLQQAQQIEFLYEQVLAFSTSKKHFVMDKSMIHL